MDDARVLSEAALVAAKSDVAEEAVRLASHLKEVAAALAKGGEMGRRLDFLAQEMLRETGTLGAKSSDLRLSALAMSMKEELERIREQAQNLA